MTNRKHDERVQQFVEQLEQADPAAQARHYAEVFSQLMGFSSFVEYVRAHFYIQYYLDEETGALAIDVQEVEAVPSKAEEAMAGAFSKMAED